MQNNTALEYNLLSFIDYKELSFWDVKSYLGILTQSNFNVVKLGKYIKHQNNKIKPNDFPEQDFEILGVNNKTGLFDAHIQKGQEINQPYKIVEDGFLAYNPYRINVGSIGLKLPEQKFKYISPAYVVFSCKSDLLPEYLFAMFKTERFNAIINENTTGSVRQNLSYNRLSQIDIPLPSIKEQKALIEAYQNKLNQAKKLEQEHSDLGEQIEEYLLKKLGIELNIIDFFPVGKLGFVDSAKINRWDAFYCLNSVKIFEQLSKSNANIVSLDKVISSYQYGLSSKSTKENNKGVPFLRMNNIQSGELDTTKLKYVPDDKSILNHILDKGDLLFNRTNSKELVGKTAVFQENERFTFASYLIRVKIDPKTANVNYINCLFNSKIIRSQIDLISRQVLGQANINSTELRELKIPLPSIDIQNNIADSIQQMKDSQKNKFQQAQQLKKQALLDFENAIFKKPTR
ncbi:restriction endonuclease subunit S [Saprospira sp. CCB-QB6]|uniref:restriction endonuclease subunit S n=1 Tax=Saprospira sp. CCB-QB6 TaxID=3023936 RepID=UPI00234B87B3|nr:restriction endonuclease subunit S [Saprospira sp. CCB-QB6]WCL82170.1 restriction endonuclease subunit S [Saprospira sp. CCB-QB6]